MHIRKHVLITLSLSALAGMGCAYADDMITQMGSWTCQPTSPPSRSCKPISFPKPFGGIPNVIVTGCQYGPLGNGIPSRPPAFVLGILPRAGSTLSISMQAWR